MEKKVYEDYKYSMQDTARLYVGSKYTFKELLDDEEIPFKFRLIMERYILPEADLEDTLETHLYYLNPDSFLVKIYKQMKARVKINVIEEKKSMFGAKSPRADLDSVTGAGKRRYVTKQITVDELAGIPFAQKERKGYVIQELSVSKLALLGL